jgi:FHA domain
VRFRLRYLQHDLELTEGPFAVGRNATCQLSLDDPLVSRRHAIFTVRDSHVEIEDLESRNGVLVNGQKITGRVMLQAGDKILIGSQEMVLMQAAGGRTSNPIPTKTTLARMPSAAPDEPSAVTKVSFIPDDATEDTSVVKRLDGFRLLGSVAEKALAMGRADEAERVLAASLVEVLDMARRGAKPAPPLAEQATRFAAKLATATGKGLWIDYVIEIYSNLARPAPAAVIDELYGAFRKASAVDVVKLRAYVEALRQRLPSFGPADRFLFQRIEGLERLAVLRS